MKSVEINEHNQVNIKYQTSSRFQHYRHHSYELPPAFFSCSIAVTKYIKYFNVKYRSGRMGRGARLRHSNAVMGPGSILKVGRIIDQAILRDIDKFCIN